MLLQLFNEINCRKVGRRDFNVFEAFLHNAYFLLVVSGTFAAQILMCECFPALTRTVSLTRSEWGACIAVGATPLLVSALLKLTPEAWVARIPTNAMVDEDRAVSSKVLSAWQSDAKAKGGGATLATLLDLHQGTTASRLPDERIGVHMNSIFEISVCLEHSLENVESMVFDAVSRTDLILLCSTALSIEPKRP